MTPPAAGSLRVDWAAPPFAGHLFPILELARQTRDRGAEFGLRVEQRVLTTAAGEPHVRSCGLPHVTLLAGCDEAVHRISDTSRRVGGSPLRLLAQLRANLALCTQLTAELDELWRDERPDVVIADFTLPFAGFAAQRAGARWWTTTPSPCAIETRTGTPSYLGGWQDHGTRLSRLRDRVGNTLIRRTKDLLAWTVRRELRALGVERLRRSDGSEVAYSGERIFALGAQEFELPREDWPRGLEFIGPLPQGPPALQRPALPIEPGRRHVLVSLGTHLAWARPRVEALAVRAARELPDWCFHVTRGRAGLNGELAPSNVVAGAPDNVTFVDYVPYDDRLAGYDAAIVHGGTGVAYACLARGVPMLLWPQDYDQFDHAARVAACGAGVRLVPRRAARDLQWLVEDGGVRDAVARMGHALSAYDPGAAVLRRLREVADGRTSGTLQP